ncbi:MAG: class II aldolase/adducin family protein [Bryobacteraceae bacterium]|jgi:L-fuculose-phosphate aldolase
MTSFDLTQFRVVTMEDVESAARAGATEVLVREGAIFTPSAREAIAAKALTVKTEPAGAAGNGASQWERLLHSPEAEVIKADIVEVGRKLWMRQYVDGNGGNISVRLNADTVICTPTLHSKADLKPGDLCLVDLAGKQLAGGKPRTSEILLHLEIYKSVPEAKAVVHCHPPHATAYAITGKVPPTCIIPEYEVFVGKVAVSPYETPGTQRFAETVIPFAKTHNTILLANHGIVCWADSVTHAEWYAEVIDTYCWTLMLAKQIEAPITSIGSEKAADLMAIKQKLGLPDERLEMKECRLCDMPEPGVIAVTPSYCSAAPLAPAGEDIETLVQAVTDAVMASLNAKSKA